MTLWTRFVNAERQAAIDLVFPVYLLPLIIVLIRRLCIGR
jgi:hypothetical protein